MSAVRDTRPFSPFELMLASRYLRARRREGFISVTATVSFLSFMVGVAALVIVMAVMNGFRKDLLSKILGLNGHMVVYKVGEPFTDYLDKTKDIRAVPGVTSAMPLIEGQAMISSTAVALGAAVRGIGEGDIKSLKLIADNIQFGSLEGFDTQYGIAIGMRLATSLRVNVGDTVTILTARGAQTPFGTAPRSKTYPIAAIFEVGMSEYDKGVVFMPLAEAQRYFSKGNDVDVLEVMVDNPERIDDYAAAIRKTGGATINLIDWRQRNETFFTVLEVERNVMFFILSLIITVAALNIISGLMMLVKDKGRDIAILRTMGATKGAVMRVFLLTGASIGIIGSLAGLALGVLFCVYIEEIRQFVSWVTGKPIFDPNIYFLTRMPAEINPGETAAIVIMAMTLSILATLYPSWRGSRLDPVEALRYE